ncbi:MAG: electron transfer flavoprotein subunit alpha/FixB family protein [Chloroflexota bacterium]
MAEYSGVLVCGEVVEGKVSSLTAELLGCSRKLADSLHEPAMLVLVGSEVSNLASQGAALGADKVFVADDALLKEYQTDAYLSVLAKLVADTSPRYILFGQSAIGRDLAPRLAFRIGAVLTTDCIELGVDPQTKGLLQTKPVYGGNARAIFTSPSFPQLATVRQKAMSPLQPDASRKAEVVTLAVKVDPAVMKSKLLQTVKEEAAGIKLEDAPIVVCGGRGIGSADGFKQLEELARMLKGAVGATRPACDSGWVPAHVQVGLTGKIVTPDLYIGVAISGASQHMAGCSGSKVIVAINKDPEANLFKEARYGVVGDWKQALPAFVNKVKELLAG